MMKRIVIGVFITTVFCFNLIAENEVPVYTDSSNQILVKLGEEFYISLDSNRTAGYEWQFSKPINNTVLEFRGSEYITSDPDLVGAGGKELWNFKSLEVGMTIVALKYVRPFERDMYPIDNKTFIVKVE